MAKAADLWTSAAGAWVSLAHLPERISRELGISFDDAVKVLRPSLEAHQIRTVVAGWKSYDHGSQSEARNWIAQGWPGDPHPYSVSASGWEHINWTAGTLCGCEVRARWEDVRQQLAVLGSRSRDTGGTAHAPNGDSVRSTGGRPIRHDWDGFWIEVTIWCESNGFEPKDRTRLQKHLAGCGKIPCSIGSLLPRYEDLTVPG